MRARCRKLLGNEGDGRVVESEEGTKGDAIVKSEEHENDDITLEYEGHNTTKTSFLKMKNAFAFHFIQ